MSEPHTPGSRTATLPASPHDPDGAGGAAPARDDGRYQLLEEVGRGGLGRVWRARDRKLGRVVALKEVLVPEGDARARLVREALVTARLEHPSIVPLYDAGRDAGRKPFYVMKLVSGRSLGEVVGETPDFAARLALVPRVAAVAEAMAYAHAHDVLHRDLKPTNVLLGEYGETLVIDWGVAKDLRAGDVELAELAGDAASDETRLGTIVGTPAYMAPEQARGEPADARADVYAVAGLLYYLLAGRAPHTGETSTEVLADAARGRVTPVELVEPNVPRELAAIVRKGMAVDPERRYPTARELAADLQRFTTGQMVGAHAYSIGQRLERWIRRHRALAAAVVASVVLGGVAVAVLAVREAGLRGVAEAERARADVQTLALLEQQTRAELASGRTAHAALYVVEALRRDPTSATLRALAAQAIAPMERLERTVHATDHDLIAMDFSADRRRFVTMSDRDGAVQVWDAASLRRLSSIEVGAEPLWQASLSADGEELVIGWGPDVSIHRAATGERLRKFPADGGRGVWLTPDRSRVIVSSETAIYLLDGHNGAELARAAMTGEWTFDLAFTPDGKRFATAGDGVVVWDLATFRPVARRDTLYWVRSIAFSPDGRRLLYAGEAGTHIASADLAPTPGIAPFDTVEMAAAAHFSPDGQLFISCAIGGLLSTHLTSSGLTLDRVEVASRHRLMTCALSADGKHVFVALSNGDLEVHRSAAGAMRLFSGSTPTAWLDAAFTLDGKAVVASGTRGALAVWDRATGVLRGSVTMPSQALHVAADATGRYVTAAHSAVRRGGQVWDMETGHAVASYEHDFVTGVATHPDGAGFASVGLREGAVRLVDFAGASVRATLPVDRSEKTAVAFHPAGRKLAVGNNNGFVYVLDAASGRVTSAWSAHGGSVDHLTYSADGARLATISFEDETARVWDAVTGKLLQGMRHEKGLAVAFSADGSWLATSGFDATTRVWNVSSGALSRTIDGASVARFAPATNELLIGGNDGLLAIVPLDSEARSPAALAAIVAEHTPWMLVDGRLVTRP